jgi:uncharacterized membrane protein (UPF0127 family)
MKKQFLILTVVLSLVIVSGCLGGNAEEVEPDAVPSGTDTGTDNSENEDGSEGDETGTDAPKPYTDAEVSFIVDGEERGRLSVEVSNSVREIERGLMDRESVPNGTGMLFVYGPNAGQRKFWMKNTLVPLDIIFVDSNLRVINVEHASPGFTGEKVCSNPDYYCSDGPAQFVVEANRGYANRTGISPGDQLVVRR